MRSWALAAAALSLTGCFIAALTVTGLGAGATTAISDLGQLAAALLACAACVTAARRSGGHHRVAWWWQAVGTGGWAAGQAVWSYDEIVAHHDVPFPSPADIGFLIFPCACAIGIVLWLGSEQHQLVARGRDLLDGAIIACSMLVLSWVTSLGKVVQAGNEHWLKLLIAMAYPVGDLVLATLVVIALARSNGRTRETLLLLAVGLGGLAVSDSAYVYLTSGSTYSSLNLVTSGWVAGFLFVAAGGLSVRRPSPHSALLRTADRRRETPSQLSLWLPYAPVIAAGLALFINLLEAPTTPPVDLVLALALVLLVLTRQFLAILDNQRLLRALGEARDQLQHQTLHDALTGLANRVLLADRLDLALLTQDAHVAVLFCDLDDFKTVNDVLGHDAGDQVLAVVARRLRRCVRDGDTVARLGGDEFAVLLPEARDAATVAERIVTAMLQPVELDGHQVLATLSVGLAELQGQPGGEQDRVTHPVGVPSAADRAAAAARLMRHADDAMYVAKRSGKARVVPARAGEAVA